MKLTNLEKLMHCEDYKSESKLDTLNVLDFKLKPLELNAIEEEFKECFIGLGIYDLTPVIEEVYLGFHKNSPLCIVKRNPFRFIEKICNYLYNLLKGDSGRTYTLSNYDLVKEENAYLKVNRLIHRGLRSTENHLSTVISQGGKCHPVEKDKYLLVQIDANKSVLQFTLSTSEGAPDAK